MLKRHKLRRYLLALLYSDEVPQSPECDEGFLFINCDGERPDVYDSTTHQLMENASGEFPFKTDSITVVFNINSESYTASPTYLGDVSLAFQIDIIANASTGEERQNMLDVVEERILYRLYSFAEFKDQETGEELKSFMLDLNKNELNITVTDQSEYDGSNTVRQMSFSYTTSECVKKMNCDDKRLCFNFKNIQIGGCNGST